MHGGYYDSHLGVFTDCGRQRNAREKGPNMAGIAGRTGAVPSRALHDDSSLAGPSRCSPPDPAGTKSAPTAGRVRLTAFALLDPAIMVMAPRMLAHQSSGWITTRILGIRSPTRFALPPAPDRLARAAHRHMYRRKPWPRGGTTTAAHVPLQVVR